MRKRNRIILLVALIAFISCDNASTDVITDHSDSLLVNNASDTSDLMQDTVVEKIHTPPFVPIDTAYNSMDLELPEGFRYDVLFTEKRDKVTRADSMKFPSKGNHDLCVYIPIKNSSEHGYLYIGHEYRYANADLGDGGGGTVFEVKKTGDSWSTIGEFKHVDFRGIRDTHRNCGGTITPWGTILSAEESFPSSNAGISSKGKYITNLDPINGRDAYTNFGWMVEIDPLTQKPLHKLYAMGRFMHEDAHCMDDGKTVYLTDDYPHAVFFKFVADQMGDYTAGQLYAFHQSEEGESGTWAEIPRDTNSLIRARDIAISNGATLFQRHEWLAESNGKLYIAETGNSEFDWTKKIDQGGKPAAHLEAKRTNGNVYTDIHGRILEFDPSTDKVISYIEAGYDVNDSSTIFSNPDCVEIQEFDGVDYLIISEDIDWYDLGRVPAHVEAAKRFVNEVYFLPLNIENPTPSDLLRFAVGPKGSETTGTYFTPDGKTMFLNIQHPWGKNKMPFNRSCTVAITGFK